MKIKKRLNAVHDDNLDIFLNNLGLKEKIQRGDEKCKFCKSPVSNDTIAAIFPEAGSIKFVCDSSECIKSLSLFLQENEFSND